MARNAQRGFTLVEMMVVVAIISILVAIAVNLRTTTYGANTSSVADQVVGQLELARARAISTHHYEQVLVTNGKLVLNEGNTLGMSVPGNFAQQIQQSVLPVSVQVWDHDTKSDATSGQHPVAALDPLLSFPITFRPDGSLYLTGGDTGATLFLTDRNHAHEFRVIVYRISGSIFSRPVW